MAAVNLALAAIVAHAGQRQRNTTLAGSKKHAQAPTGKGEENRIFALTLLFVAMWALSKALFRAGPFAGLGEGLQQKSKD